MNPQVASCSISNFYPTDYAPHKKKLKSTTDKKKNQVALPATILEKLSSERVLDVGCGNGEFLNRVRNRFGCKVEGIDISRNAVKTARKNYNLKIFQGDIPEYPFQDNPFDLITAFSYIEHVHDPNATIKKMSELLKPNGIFLIKTPNINSLAGKVFRSKWYHVDCPRHLYIFSPKTLSILIKQNGLSVEKILYDKSSKGWTSSLQYCLYGNNYQHKYRNKIKHSKTIRAFVSPLAKIAYLLNQSDVMTIYGFKKGK